MIKLQSGEKVFLKYHIDRCYINDLPDGIISLCKIFAGDDTSQKFTI